MPRKINPDEPPKGKGTYFVFSWYIHTIANYDPECDKELLAKKLMENDDWKKFMVYCFWSLEKGENKNGLAERADPNNDGYHLQGFFKCDKQRDWYWVKKQLHPGISYNVMGADVAKNWDYCSKGDTHIAGPWEFGPRPKGSDSNKGEKKEQGKRTDLKELQETLHTLGYVEASRLHFKPWVAYNRGIKSYCQLHGIPTTKSKPRSRKTYTILVYGDANCGKSSVLLNHFANQYYEVSSTTSNTVWCENVISDGIAYIEDMDGGTMAMAYFKRLVNNLPINIYPRSGDPDQFNPSMMFISAQDHPRQWWPNRYAANEQHLVAVLKRFDTIWHFHKDTVTGLIIRTVEKGDTEEQFFERFKEKICIPDNLEHVNHLASCFERSESNDYVTFSGLKFICPSTAGGVCSTMCSIDDMFSISEENESNRSNSSIDSMSDTSELSGDIEPDQYTSNGTLIVTEKDQEQFMEGIF